MVNPSHPPLPEPSPRYRRLRLLAVLAFVACIGAVLLFGPKEADILHHQAAFKEYVQARFIPSWFIFLVATILALSLSLPMSAGLSILAGFLFGRWWGAANIAIGATIGATIAFLSSRYLLRATIYQLAASRPRIARWIERINGGLEREGSYYLLMLRLVGVVPYFVLNFICGLTTVRLFTYAWTCLVGMLPVMFVYVHAGASVGEITRFRDLVSWQILLAMMLMVLVPITLRWLLRKIGAVSS